ncbi:MAG: HU family DNA-binding protein [Bacteroides sp.]|nr:HU family DNA-binding protein [Bacteroides sp.]
MAANYELKESNLPTVQEGKKLYPCIVSSGTIKTSRLVNHIASATTFTPGEIRGLLHALSDTMAGYLKNGYHVELGDIGYFSLKIKAVTPIENKKVRAEFIRAEKVKFRTSASFRRKIAGDFKRHPHPKEATVLPSIEVCRKKLQAYLKENHFITRILYSRLTGCNKYYALKQLNEFTREGWLKRKGAGNQLLFVKAAQRKDDSK